MIAKELKCKMPSAENRISSVLADMDSGTKEALLVWLCEEITGLPGELYDVFMDTLSQDIGLDHSLTVLLYDIRRKNEEE